MSCHSGEPSEGEHIKQVDHLEVINQRTGGSFISLEDPELPGMLTSVFRDR